MGDADVAAVATLLGEPARAAIMVALMDGSAHRAGELASRAGVSASTASGHLARLLSGGLVVCDVNGRERRYRLASAEVASALEALCPHRTRRGHPVPPLVRESRCDPLGPYLLRPPSRIRWRWRYRGSCRPRSARPQRWRVCAYLGRGRAAYSARSRCCGGARPTPIVCACLPRLERTSLASGRRARSWARARSHSERLA
jgi:DNA-binding transcriptional ArsR family regulator